MLGLTLLALLSIRPAVLAQKLDPSRRLCAVIF